MTGDEMEALFEREKFAYLEKSKYLQDQLETFKSDIEDLKRDDKISEMDKLHRQQQNQGENKYSTIQKVRLSLGKPSIKKCVNKEIVLICLDPLP